VCGGEIVKENRTYYETTWLIKRNDALLSDDRSGLYEDPAVIRGYLKTFFEAHEALSVGDYGKVIELWPNCPSAWVGHYEMNRKALHEKGFDFIYNEICLKGLDATGEDADLHYLCADVAARYDEYERAIAHLKRANELRPNMPNVFALLSNCFRSLAKVSKEPEIKIKFYQQARHASQILGEIAAQHKGEALTWVMFDNSNIPTPWETTEVS
jgi:tetratricopeptide (TPR) repeat protein